MDDLTIDLPKFYQQIQADSAEIGFSMPSDLQTGSLLRTLVASKPSGQFLELGTGTGLSLAWIVAGMNEGAAVVSIDNHEGYTAIAKQYFSQDNRVNIFCGDGRKWILENQERRFDLIFADTWPGKYDTLDETLSLLKPGGIYFIDDMLQQPNWPAEHPEKVEKLVRYLDARTDFKLTKMNWSTGIILGTKIH